MAIAPKICRCAGVSTAQILPVGVPSATMSADCPENANTASGIPASVPSGASCAFGHIAKARFHKNAKNSLGYRNCLFNVLCGNRVPSVPSGLTGRTSGISAQRGAEPFEIFLPEGVLLGRFLRSKRTFLGERPQFIDPSFFGFIKRTRFLCRTFHGQKLSSSSSYAAYNPSRSRICVSSARG